MRLNSRICFLLSFAIALGGCTKEIIQTETITPEEGYCSTVTSYTGSTSTVDGVAEFTKGFLDASGLNVTVSATQESVRYAEVQVKDISGNVVQCTETDGTGNFSFIVPQGPTYTAYVNSRGYNLFVRASVLNLPSENQYYSISQPFIASAANVNMGTLTAPATGTITGGAFNIFDQIVKANLFLSSTASNCSTFFAGCLNFTVAPKVQAYWTPGFNPATLFGSSSNLSFYVPGTSKLYILGGSGTSYDTDNVKDNDTDHYDDSVIVHEYGHFIEDMYADTDSPGGSHDANSIVDPRLAWGEGWANFFSLVVPSNPIYQDTYGNNQGTTKGNFFYHNLETNNPVRDVPTQSGEGNFREFSITRSLWDAMDNGNENGAGGVENIQAQFREFWHIFTGSFKTGGGFFRDFGLFTFLHDNLGGSTDLSTIFDDNDKRQLASRTNYASDITATQKQCGVIIKALTGYGEDGSYENSNQFNSNDFYYIQHPGGTLSVNLTYTNLAGGLDDLDLWVYKEGYVLGNNSSSSAIGISVSDPPGVGPATESVSVSAAAGNYLINVQYYTGSTSPLPWTDHQYDLTVGSATCP